MNRRIRMVGYAALIVPVAMLLAPKATLAEDWANWRGPEQNHGGTIAMTRMFGVKP